MSRRGRAVRLVLTATFLYASVPPILHLAASDTNPFYFNFMITIMQVSIPGLFLLYSKDSYVNRYLSTPQRRDLRRPSVHFTHFRRTSGTTGNRKAVLLEESGRNDVLGWARMPIVWALISSLHYGFLAWSATILETAIATTIFELWPVFLVYALARHEDSDRLFRGGLVSIGHARRAISKEGMVLTALAGSGLALMLGSQAGGHIRSVVDLVSYKVAAGMVIAVVASLLAALSVLSNLAYGKVLYYALVPAGGTQASGRHGSLETRPIEQRGDPDRRLLVWLTLLGYVLSRLLALPVNVLIGLLAPQVQGSLTPAAVLGALVIGAAVSVAGMLLRVGNIGSDDTAVNSLLCLGPAVSLLALMALGITLPRFDLFVVGAALILAVNVRIQLRREAGHRTR